MSIYVYTYIHTYMNIYKISLILSLSSTSFKLYSSSKPFASQNPPLIISVQSY